MGLGDPVYCVTPDCPEYGIGKPNPGGYPLEEGEQFVCGECQEPLSDAPPRPEPRDAG